jgi:hypothetical protein
MTHQMLVIKLTKIARFFMFHPIALYAPSDKQKREKESE